MHPTPEIDRTACFHAIFAFYNTYFQLPASDFEKDKFRLTLPILPLPILKCLCETVRESFKSEPMVLQIAGPVIVVGDLHGHLLDLLRTIRTFGPPPTRSYLFLGDLVDRGEFSTETVELIFVLKALFSKNIYCIRGNHEFDQMIEQGGFSDELCSIYHVPDAEPWILDAFSWMPIAAVIGKSVLCVHGGIGPEVQSIEQLAAIPRPLLDYDTEVVQS
jgi:protein phosphatase